MTRTTTHPKCSPSMQRRRAVAVAALCVLAGCAADELDPAFESSPADSDIAAQRVVRTTQPTVQSLVPKIGAATFSGSLCSAEQSTFNTNPGAFTLNTADLLDGTNPATTRGRCDFSVDFTMPAGYSLGGPAVCTLVYLLGNLGTEPTAKVSLRTSIPGSGRVGSTQQTFRGAGVHLLCGSYQEQRTPTCRDTSREQAAKLAVSVDVEVGAGTQARLQALESDLTFQEGAHWTACNGSSTALPAPSAAEGPCRGPNRQPCASGLTCKIDRAPTLWLSGTCTDPVTARQPRTVGELCSAELNLTCQPGLTCRNRPALLPENRLTGVCNRPTAAVGEACGELPAPECAEGLTCSAAGVCQAPQERGEGDACDEDNIKCPSQLTCDVSTRVCRKSTGDRLEACDPLKGALCQDGLECSTNGTCVRVDGPPGSSCSFRTECRSNQCDRATRTCL